MLPLALQERAPALGCLGESRPIHSSGAAWFASASFQVNRYALAT